MTTQAQIDANRRNAQKSTGPRTKHGKSRVRENALTHGLTAGPNALTPELFRAAQAYWDDLVIDHQPRGRYQRLLLSEAALALAQLERLPVIREYHRMDDQTRAVNSWENDRSDEAGRLGEQLRRKPSRTVERLGRTAHGAAWMIRRWRALDQALDAGEPWSAEQRETAQALLGLDPELLTPASRIGEETPVERLRDLTTKELERWTALKAERLDPLDDLERQLAVTGAAFEDSAAARRFHRYERDCYKKLNEAWAKLREAKEKRTEWDGGGDSENEAPSWTEALREYQAAGEFDRPDPDDASTPEPESKPESESAPVEAASDASERSKPASEPSSEDAETPIEAASDAGAEKQSRSPEASEPQSVPSRVATDAAAASTSSTPSSPTMAGRGKAYREMRRQHRAARLRADASSG